MAHLKAKCVVFVQIEGPHKRALRFEAHTTETTCIEIPDVQEGDTLTEIKCIVVEGDLAMRLVTIPVSPNCLCPGASNRIKFSSSGMIDLS